MTNTALLKAQYIGKGTNAYFNYVDVGATNATISGLLVNKTTSATSAASFGTVGAITGTGIVFAPVQGVDFATSEVLAMFHTGNTNVIQQDIPAAISDYCFTSQNILPTTAIQSSGGYLRVRDTNDAALMPATGILSNGQYVMRSSGTTAANVDGNGNVRAQREGRFLLGQLGNVIMTAGRLPNSDWIETSGGVGPYAFSIRWTDPVSTSPTFGQTLEIGTTDSFGETPTRFTFASGTNWADAAFAGTVDALTSGGVGDDKYVDGAQSNIVAVNGTTFSGSNVATDLSGVPAAVDAELTTQHGAGSWANVATGTGAYAVAVNTYSGTNSLTGVQVRLDNGASSFVSNTGTNSSLTFNVDSGSWTLSATKSGYSYAGQTVPVSGSLTGTNAVTVTMTANSIASPPTPDQIRGLLTIRDASGNAIANQQMKFRMTAGPGTAGNAYVAGVTVTSNTNGAIVDPYDGEVGLCLPLGSTFEAHVSPNGNWSTITVPTNGASFNIPEIVGTKF